MKEGDREMTDERDFSDIPVAERIRWADEDPDGYHAAARTWARAHAERDVAEAVRRRLREGHGLTEDRRGLAAPFRWLWKKARRW